MGTSSAGAARPGPGRHGAGSGRSQGPGRRRGTEGRPSAAAPRPQARAAHGDLEDPACADRGGEGDAGRGAPIGVRAATVRAARPASERSPGWSSGQGRCRRWGVGGAAARCRRAGHVPDLEDGRTGALRDGPTRRWDGVRSTVVAAASGSRGGRTVTASAIPPHPGRR
ncbi:MAG: hypothetical protein FJW94_06290 [Actinobacteria bacterium]|nr:hypothetical protein [Actinomycetota bacterium]